MISSLFDIAKYLVGELPPQYAMFYYILVFGLAVGLIFCLFSPFILVYKMLISKQFIMSSLDFYILDFIIEVIIILIIYLLLILFDKR